MSGQDCRQLTLFQGGSPVSRTALQESVWRLVMTVISGQKCGVSLETLTPDGSWEKTYGDYYQVKMDGFSAESFGTLPKWGIVSDGVLQALPQLEPYIDESGLRLLPTPTSSWGKHNIGISETPKHRYSQTTEHLALRILGKSVTPPSVELMMGFPLGWTDLSASETQ